MTRRENTEILRISAIILIDRILGYCMVSDLIHFQTQNEGSEDVKVSLSWNDFVHNFPATWKIIVKIG